MKGSNTKRAQGGNRAGCLTARDDAFDGQNLGYWLERQRSADRVIGAGGLKPSRGEWLDRNLPEWNTDFVARHAPAAGTPPTSEESSSRINRCPPTSPCFHGGQVG